MSCLWNKCFGAVVLFSVVMVGLWFVVPKPELIVSILIRMVACGAAVYIAVKCDEWKILFLAAMFFLMASRQVLTLLIWTGAIERTQWFNTLSELPGFVVTILSLVSIIYLGLILSGKKQIIQRQDANIKELNSLLPICSKCRKIRDDDGYWQDLEAYIVNHTDSEFTHGVCESCSDEMYGGQAWYEKAKKKRAKK
ncbi:hypothetical protein [Desulfovibrio sp. JC010]|uniref:hypothetical protein n=1 Tax=Desulfovibrio sp. JC010 TaxID=2593641 RepID=UPI0013D7024C|nr:hypothetical protein [Desulfovibrio sp. JC010]NDV28714.1 hypothetical protein [Desulfovibrio sp. JC010]